MNEIVMRMLDYIVQVAALPLPGGSGGDRANKPKSRYEPYSRSGQHQAHPTRSPSLSTGQHHSNPLRPNPHLQVTDGSGMPNAQPEVPVLTMDPNHLHVFGSSHPQQSVSTGQTTLASVHPSHPDHPSHSHHQPESSPPGPPSVPGHPTSSSSSTHPNPVVVPGNDHHEGFIPVKFKSRTVLQCPRCTAKFGIDAHESIRTHSLTDHSAKEDAQQSSGIGSSHSQPHPGENPHKMDYYPPMEPPPGYIPGVSPGIPISYPPNEPPPGHIPGVSPGITNYYPPNEPPPGHIPGVSPGIPISYLPNEPPPGHIPGVSPGIPKYYPPDEPPPGHISGVYEGFTLKGELYHCDHPKCKKKYRDIGSLEPHKQSHALEEKKPKKKKGTKSP